MKLTIKNFLSLVSFLLGFVLLLLLFSQLLQPKGNAKEDGMRDASANGILSEPEETIDVLFLGDSEAYCSFIPLQIWQEQGITSYVCSTPAQKLFYSMEFLRKTFETQSPKVVILETHNIFEKYNAFSKTKNEIQAYFSIFRYHNRWKSLTPQDLNFAVNYTYVDNTKGYIYNTAVNGADPSRHMEPSTAQEPIPDTNFAQLQEMYEFCQEHGAQLILVSTPSTVNWNSARHNRIEALAAEWGIPYLDLNVMTGEVPIDWNTDTRDKGDHLNYRGAQKVSRYVGQYLADMGVFTDKRTDAEYQVWHDAVAQFQKTTHNALELTS